MNLLTKEEIESAGFIYEPDESKCHYRKIHMHFDCNYYKDGRWTERTTPLEITPEWKEACKKAMFIDCYYWTHINKVFVQDISPLDGAGVMCRRTLMMGYGLEITKKWYGTGLLEGLKPNQMDAGALYLNKIAQEIIESNPKLGTPEYEKLDCMGGILLSVARLIFDDKYPNNPPDPKWLMEDFEKFFDANKEVYNDLKKGSFSMDYDKEFGEFYVKSVEERLKEKLYSDHGQEGEGI